MAERSRVVYWALTGALLFAGFYVSFYGELPPHLLLAGAAMAGGGMLAFGGRKIWAMVLGIPVAFSVAFLLNIIVGGEHIGHRLGPYSPNLVEGEICELRV